MADGGSVYWTESRPAEGGRQVVVRCEPGGPPGSGPVDVSPAGVSVRSRAHEYGGGAAVVAGGMLVYVDQDDQAWHRFEPAAAEPPVRLGVDPEQAGTVRHADGRPIPGGRWLVSVEERITPDGTTHRLIVVPTRGTGRSTELVAPGVHGHFVAAPRPSPDGRWLAWVVWDHPDMPWDTSRLQVAPLSSGAGMPVVGPSVTVAGGTGNSVGQPRWMADGSLVFVDDRTGWWLPYRVPGGSFVGDGPEADSAVALVADEAEYHGPDWVFGQHTFDELADGSLAAVRRAGGRDHLVVLRPPSAGPDHQGWSRTDVDQPCVGLSAVVSPDGRTLVVLGSTPTEAQAVLAVDPTGEAPPRRLSAAPAVPVVASRVSPSVPRVGHTDGQRVPGQFFRPVHPDGAPAGPPPLVVFCHGGPTSSAEAGYDPVVQFLTSRGIAVAAVDYRGSSGYGRAYRDRLRGAWGEGDVDDCIAYAESLAADGAVDGRRMAIRGSSAGGMTALAALVRARCFAGAVAWYGVTDLLALATDTHDFESRYLDGLVGPLPGAEPTYRSRSPIHQADRLAGRVLLLQGSDDPIVPVSQAEQFAERLRSAGAGCRLLVFEGESHGFRRASTIEAALTAELDFYRGLFAPGGTDGR